MRRLLLNTLSRTQFSDYLLASQKAMRELTSETFNSKTLKTFYSNDAYVSTKPNTVIVQSRETRKPVEIVYMRYKDKVNRFLDGFVFNFFREPSICCIGSKDFQIKRPLLGLGSSKVQPGMMWSDADDLIGIGVREDELQIREALKQGVKKISRYSTQRAVLYHVKMGYLPKPKLIRIRQPQKIKVEMAKIMEMSPDVKPEFFTPIIVEKKGLFGTRYYLDKNTTQAISNIRQIKLMSKGDPLRTRRIRFRADHVEMELSGDRLEAWRQMINRAYDFNK